MQHLGLNTACQRLTLAFGWACLILSLGGCATEARAPSPLQASPEAAPQLSECPAGLQGLARCLFGQDSAGAHYVIAVPRDWNGNLVLHAHGGPSLGTPKLDRSVEDLRRWAVVVNAGYAWAGSSFRQGGVAVRAAAEDTERLRHIFKTHVGEPRRTLLHGQSWGASVAAVGAEMFTAHEKGGKPPYDAVLLTSGVLAGGTQAYQFRLDLRVIYQQLCGNHPAPDEPAYPLWMGLPAGAQLTQAQLAQRVNQCLGLDQARSTRRADQQRKVQTLVKVIGIPERSILSHLNWATWHFQDIVQKRTGGLNPFGNVGVRYRGSEDDEALNAAVLRYAADPGAVARFAADADPQGRIAVPVLTVHGVRDPTAFVEMSHHFAQTMARGGSSARLVQTFTDDAEHSYLSDPVYPTLLSALLHWVEQGVKPTPLGIAQACEAAQMRFGPGCRFLPDYQAQPLHTRVPAR